MVADAVLVVRRVVLEEELRLCPILIGQPKMGWSADFVHSYPSLKALPF